jgi:phospholipid/cholesterol/gamma-HCH transport system substrate-binding protein
MKKYTQETVVGIFVVIGLFAIAYLYAKYSNVTGLRVGNPVNMFGLEIGRVRVESFKMDQENQVAVVELKINNGIEIYDDAIASIKTEGLIGDKFVSIDAGGGGDLLANGDTITDTESPTDIMELVSKYAFGDVGGEEKE